MTYSRRQSRYPPRESWVKKGFGFGLGMGCSSLVVGFLSIIGFLVLFMILASMCAAR